MGFGGKNLDHLFITTATLHVEQSASQHQPLAGSLFVADLGSLGIHGVPENIFKIPRK
jgi:sugar lactone lactonase YvrE